MINSYVPENESATTIEAIGARLIVNVPEGMPLVPRDLSNASSRMDVSVLKALEDGLSRLGQLVSRVDLEAMGTLLSRPALLQGILTLLERAREFMWRLGLRLGEHFQFEVSLWVDYEVDGWSYLQVKAALLGAGVSLMAEGEIDKFALLKALTSIATQTLPREARREVVVSVE